MTCTNLKGKLRLPRELDIGRASLQCSECMWCARHYSKRLEQIQDGGEKVPSPVKPALWWGNQTCALQTDRHTIEVPWEWGISTQEGGAWLSVDRASGWAFIWALTDEEHLNKGCTKAQLSLLCSLRCSPYFLFYQRLLSALNLVSCEVWASSLPHVLLFTSRKFLGSCRLSPTGSMGVSRPQRIYFGSLANKKHVKEL